MGACAGERAVTGGAHGAGLTVVGTRPEGRVDR